MQVCSQLALALRKISCNIISTGSPTARNYITGGIQMDKNSLAHTNVFVNRKLGQTLIEN